MTDAAIDLAHSILTLVGNFVRNLPADQLTDLVSGDAKLAVLPKGARVPGAEATTGSTRRVTAVKPLPISATQLKDDLAKIGDRAAATRLIGDLKMTGAQLKQVCAELGIPLKSKTTNPEIIRIMVELLVGRRADADAIMRNSGAPRGWLVGETKVAVDSR